MTHLNSNGLVGGNIPAGQPCPFIANCVGKVDECPSADNLKPCGYSCGMARLHSTLMLTKKRR